MEPFSVPVAILTGAIVGLIGVFLGWSVQWRIAQVRATIDFISRHEVSNPNWQATVQGFTELTKDPNHPQALIELLDPQDDEQLHRRLAVSSLLNHFEMVAVGIENEAFSAAIYKDWGRSTYVETWKKAESYIIERRNEAARPTAYIHFEKLAREWSAEQ